MKFILQKLSLKSYYYFTCMFYCDENTSHETCPQELFRRPEQNPWLAVDTDCTAVFELTHQQWWTWSYKSEEKCFHLCNEEYFLIIFLNVAAFYPQEKITLYWITVFID